MTTKHLKGVILSLENTLINSGSIKKNIFDEVGKFMAFLSLRGLKPVLLSNRSWTVSNNSNDNTEDGFSFLKNKFQDLEIFSPHIDRNIPFKPNKGATQYVLEKMGWQANEVLYIGSSEDDMRTAVNGKMLFLRATWYSDNTDYGFEFNEPKDMARFIDTLCLRQHFWSHMIKDGDFEYYALAPFSTLKTEFRKYSEDARLASKSGQGNVDFWLGALVTSMYFTGIHERIDFITAYPGHKKGVGNDKMENDLIIFGKCFNKAYLHDLIERHTDAIKSQTARQKKIPIDHHNQLNTIRLNQFPTRNLKKKYKHPPLKSGKTVLLIDDICTKGWSINAASKYINRTGVKVIMVTWLKTINVDIQEIGALPTFDPYSINNFQNISSGKTYGYHTFHVDQSASEELNEQFQQYINWEWPLLI